MQPPLQPIAIGRDVVQDVDGPLGEFSVDVAIGFDGCEPFPEVRVFRGKVADAKVGYNGGVHRRQALSE